MALRDVRLLQMLQKITTNLTVCFLLFEKIKVVSNYEKFLKWNFQFLISKLCLTSEEKGNPTTLLLMNFDTLLFARNFLKISKFRLQLLSENKILEDIFFQNQ